MLYWTDTNIFGFTVQNATIGLIVTFFLMLGLSVGVGMTIRIMHDVTIRYPKFIAFFTRKIW